MSPPVSIAPARARRPISRPPQGTPSIVATAPPGPASRAALYAIAIVSALVAGAAPLSGLDDRARSWALALTASSRTSERMIVVELTPGDLRRGACDGSLSEIARRGGAKGVLLPPALDALCDVSEGSALARLPASALHLGPDGEIAGFDMSAPELSGARDLGVHTAKWVARRAPGSVPIVELGALTAGRVPASVLAGRVIVASLAVPGAGIAFEQRVADAVAGALDGQRREETPPWVGPIVPLAATAGAFAVRKRHGGRVAAAVPVLAWLVAIGAHLGLAAAGLGLSPLASVLAATAIVPAALISLALLNWRRAATYAGHILRTAEIATPRSLVTAEGEALWTAVKEIAADSFPAELVLIAEHDAAASALRFRDLPDESAVLAVSERDPRRPPFRDEDGIFAPRLVHGFVRGSDAPALLVPLSAHGELLGYVVLVGGDVARLHEADPSRSQVLGDELGLLIHQARSGADRATPIDERRPSMAQITGSALSVSEHAYFLAEMVNALPMGVAWADETGRVREMNRRLVETLAENGVQLAGDPGAGSLQRGDLVLVDLLAHLTGKTDVDVLQAMRGTGLVATVPLGDPPLPFRVHARAMRHRGAGQKAIAGYLVTLFAEGSMVLPIPDRQSMPSPLDAGLPRAPLDTIPSPA